METRKRSVSDLAREICRVCVTYLGMIREDARTNYGQLRAGRGSNV